MCAGGQSDGGDALPHSGARYILWSTNYLPSEKGNACADKLHSLAFDYSDRCVGMRVGKEQGEFVPGCAFRGLCINLTRAVGKVESA
jgi:hypothetical protein